jgi:hypothetical protein
MAEPIEAEYDFGPVTLDFGGPGITGRKVALMDGGWIYTDGHNQMTSLPAALTQELDFRYAGDISGYRSSEFVSAGLQRAGAMK